MSHKCDSLKYLGAGDADLGPGIDVHATVRLATDCAANGVRDAYDECTTWLAVAQRQQRVRSLA